jgi:hypothetical protein
MPSTPDQSDSEAERVRRVEREIAEAAARAAARSDLEGRVMRSPGGSDLVRRIDRYPMKRIKA